MGSPRWNVGDKNELSPELEAEQTEEGPAPNLAKAW